MTPSSVSSAPASPSPTSVYWTDYDPLSPPPRTSDAHVRFVILSDTHSTEPADVPEGDVLLHAGDLTAFGSDDEMERQVQWLTSLPHATKVVIAGNHDFSACYDWYDPHGLEIHSTFGYPPSDVGRVQRLLSTLPANIVYLENEAGSFTVQREGVRKKNWKVWGSPWSPWFHGWAWNYNAGEEAKKVHAGIPGDVDVLMTHTPPESIGGLDKISSGANVGCPELTRKMMVGEGEVRPLLHAFGHVHEARGVHRHRYERPTADGRDETLFVNAALVEINDPNARGTAASDIFRYHVVNKPVIVDVLGE